MITKFSVPPFKPGEHPLITIQSVLQVHVLKETTSQIKLFFNNEIALKFGITKY